MPGEDVVDRIVDLMGPYIGPHMAKAAVEVHSKNLSLNLERLSQADLEALAERIAQGFRVMVGEDKSRRVQQAISHLPLT